MLKLFLMKYDVTIVRVFHACMMFITQNNGLMGFGHVIKRNLESLEPIPNMLKMFLMF